MMTRITALLTQRLPVSAAAALAAAVIVIVFAYMWSTASGGPSISESVAIQAAITEVESDSVMSLDGRDTIAEVDGGNWHVYFPYSLVPQVLWGDVNCSGDVEGGDALDILREAGELTVEPIDGCPQPGTVIDPANICEDAFCSNALRGGEPHVIVNGSDGTVEEIYYTQ